LLDVVVHRQQLTQAKRGAHRRHTRPGALGARHVVQQIVEQLERWRIGIARFTLLVQALQLTIRLTEQAFDRGTAFEATFAQGLHHRANHPPQLEYCLGGRELLDFLSRGAEGFKVLTDALALDPAEQTDLETAAQLACPLRHRHRTFARRRRLRISLLIGTQVQQQQRAFGQQCMTAHRTQIVQ
jgi:hypothetical protein